MPPEQAITFDNVVKTDLEDIYWFIDECRHHVNGPSLKIIDKWKQELNYQYRKQHDNSDSPQCLVFSGNDCRSMINFAKIYRSKAKGKKKASDHVSFKILEKLGMIGD